MSNLSVLFFLPSLDGGGAEMNAVRLAPVLLSSGIVPIYAVAKPCGRFTKLLPKNVEVVHLTEGKTRSSSKRLLECRRGLLRLLETRKPDVLCSVMAPAAFVALSIVGGIVNAPPVVVSLENTQPFVKKRWHSISEILQLALMWFLFPRAECVIAKSQGMAADVIRTLPALRNKVHVLYNICVLPAWSELPRSAHADRSRSSIRVLACGRLTPVKDYPTLLRAFALVVSIENCLLEIIGDGTLREELELLCTTLGISQQVRFLGFQEDVSTYLSKADIFVHSSKSEAFGMAIVEAMAMGAAVIATDCPHGPREIITHGVNGLLVPPGDSSALAISMLQLCKDGAMRDRLAAAGRRRSLDFTPERIGRGYVDTFRHSAKKSTDDPVLSGRQ